MGFYKGGGPEAAPTGNTAVVYHENQTEWKRFLRNHFENTDTPVEVVDWYASPEEMNRNGQRNGGFQSYVISTISESPKYSDTYLSCTGVILMGRDRKTGKRISLLSHQDVLSSDATIEAFLSDLKDAAGELYARIDPDSLSVGFIGSSPAFRREYNQMVKKVTVALEEVMGKPLTVISEPILPVSRSTGTAVFVDTEAGMVHVAAGVLNGKSEEEPRPSRRFADDARKQRNTEGAIRVPMEIV